MLTDSKVMLWRQTEATTHGLHSYLALFPELVISEPPGPPALVIISDRRMSNEWLLSRSYTDELTTSRASSVHFRHCSRFDMVQLSATLYRNV